MCYSTNNGPNSRLLRTAIGHNSIMGTNTQKSIVATGPHCTQINSTPQLIDAVCRVSFEHGPICTASRESLLCALAATKVAARAASSMPIKTTFSVCSCSPYYIPSGKDGRLSARGRNYYRFSALVQKVRSSSSWSSVDGNSNKIDDKSLCR